MHKKLLLPTLIASVASLLVITNVQAKEQEWWDDSYEQSYQVNEKIEVNESASGQDGASVNVSIKNTVNANGVSQTEIKTSKSPNPTASPSPSSSTETKPTPTPDPNLSASTEAEIKTEVLGDTDSSNLFVKVWAKIKSFWQNFFGLN